MRKFIVALMTSAFLAAGAVSGTAGLAQASTAPAATHIAPAHAGAALWRPGGSCPTCRI